MKNSISPLVSVAVIAVVLVLVGFGIYKAAAPPRYGADSHGGQPYGDHMPPAIAHYGSDAAPPAPAKH